MATSLPPSTVSSRRRPATFLALAAALTLAAVELRATWSAPGTLDAVLTSAIAGALAVALGRLARGVSGLRPLNLLRDALFLCALAAMADPSAAVWHPPESWHALLGLSPAGSVSAQALYVLGVAGTRAGSGHAAAAVLLAVPLLSNWLLLLTSPALAAELGRSFAPVAPMGDAVASTLGRGLVLIVFNEAVVVGLAAAIRGSAPRDLRVHLLLLASAAYAVFTPWIADATASPRFDGLVEPFATAAVVVGSMLCQIGLWGQTYLVTGVLMGALRGNAPTLDRVARHWREGGAKAAVYSGCFMLLLRALDACIGLAEGSSSVADFAMLVGAVAGAASFPLVKTIVESFDGSPPFFGRLRASWRLPDNYVRGFVLGGALGFVLGHLSPDSEASRIAWGAAVGALAYGGVDVLLDLAAIARHRRRRLQAARIYGFGALLGATVGSALAWYFDPPQLAAVSAKLARYVAVDYHMHPEIEISAYVIYPLFSKWGAVDLGVVQGGVRLFFNESLSGVINWSLAAPLFSINLVLLTALVEKSYRPLRALLTRDGVAGMVEQAFRVQRWGLWMAPIIYSLLRLAPEPTWYNQDGAVRTAVAIAESVARDPGSFRNWSLEVFLGLLAYDWLRVVIWFDHMGLRVATLVNASFVVGDVVDEKSAALLGHSMRSRVIPEGIRRFATWGPLLIPFYLPRGADWQHVWNEAEVVGAGGGPLLPAVATVASAYAAAAALVLAGGAALWWRRPRTGTGASLPAADFPLLRRELELKSDGYTLTMTGDGQGFAHVAGGAAPPGGIDLTRRPAGVGRSSGKFFYLREIDARGEPSETPWSLTYQPTRHLGAGYAVELRTAKRIEITNRRGAIRADATVVLDEHDTVEIRTLRLTNEDESPRVVEITSYQELTISARDAYERHPAYHALHVGTLFVASLGAVLAHNRKLGSNGAPVVFHAVRHGCDGVELTGYEDSRSLFIGAGTLARPEAIESSDLRAIEDQGLAYTFDPAASLQVRVDVPAGATVEVRFVDGVATGIAEAAALIARHLALPPPEPRHLEAVASARRLTLDRHRRRPDEPAFEFSADGSELRVGWDTSRPWHHVLANARGHGAVLGNDGSIFSFAGNSQQNGLTPFLPDTVPAQQLGQCVYVVDLETGRIDTPGFAPLRRDDVRYQVAFSRGHARYSSSTRDTDLELDVILPPEQRLELKLLRIRNRTGVRRRFRVVPFFELVLGEISRDTRGRLEVESDRRRDAVFFSCPENEFYRGQGFAAWSVATEAFETSLSRFIGGPLRDQTRPLFVETGRRIEEPADRDEARVAAFCGIVEVEPGGVSEVAIVFGQAADRTEAEKRIEQYADPVRTAQALTETREWWAEKLSTLRIETTAPELDRLVNDWLPYQALVARLWGRTGPSQRSGGFGYRDQLQDVIPFAVLDPALARSQILLHASRQFLEGDVLQWWHESWDGRVGLGARNHASDPHLWLVHVVDEYVAATGDASVLAERTPFVEGPRVPLAVGGSVFVPRASRDEASVYEHCRLAVDHALSRRSGRGLPLIERGDWNDGLDEVGGKGRGESVWLGFFLYDSLQRLARLARLSGREADAARYEAELAPLAAALDGMWRDGRYVRATTDAGDELDFASALTAAWPALSGATSYERAAAALDRGLAELERDLMVSLLDPPFTEASRPYPGKIADYPPGVRENGGQYSHGVSWLVDASVRLAERAERGGDTEGAAQRIRRAVELWWKISPLRHADGEHCDRYGLPPHQQAADVYFAEGYAGRGGWSWYTGAAARMLSAAYAMLGLRFEGGRVTVAERAARASGTVTLLRVTHRGATVFERR